MKFTMCLAHSSILRCYSVFHLSIMICVDLLNWNFVITLLFCCVLCVWLSRVQLCATLWTTVAPPGSSVHGASPGKYWSGLPCPPPGDLPKPGRIYATKLPLFLVVWQNSRIIPVTKLWSCCCCVASVVSNSSWPHRQQPTRIFCLWDSPGKNTGMGCHFLLQCMHACMLSHFSRVWLCATLWTAAHQAPLSTGFSRQEYWSGSYGADSLLKFFPRNKCGFINMPFLY